MLASRRSSEVWLNGHFSGSIEQMVGLVLLTPVVASVGGVAGTQTLTLLTRGLALDQVGPASSCTRNSA